MSKRPPVDSPTTLLEALDRVGGRPERHLDENAPHRCLGMPSGIHTSDQRPRYGDLLYMDPTNASAAIIVTLPPGDRTKRGEKITVKNYSASTNTIRVVAQDGETIDKATSKDMAIAWQLATFLLIAEHEWICFRGDGCL